MPDPWRKRWKAFWALWRATHKPGASFDRDNSIEDHLRAAFPWRWVKLADATDPLRSNLPPLLRKLMAEASKKRRFAEKLLAAIMREDGE